MSFRPPKEQPEFSDLKGILAQSNKQDRALYQTVQKIIERLEQFKGVINTTVEGKQDKTGTSSGSASVSASFHTKDNEISILPNSVQLLAGTGIIFDDTVANKRTISSAGGGGLGNHYDSPLTDGDLIETELIFALGECIIVQVPV